MPESERTLPARTIQPATVPATASEYETERRGKLAKLRELGHSGFGRCLKTRTTLADAKAMYIAADHGHDAGPVVTIAGRVILKRDMGKLSFLTLRDDTGDLQVALDRKRLDDDGWAVRGLVDLADQIVVTGRLGTTNKGEVTVWGEGAEVSAKALLPPPDKYHGLEDTELRYRRRYVDLWANPSSMQVLKKRSAIIESIRQFLLARGFLEVETPMLQPIHGGAAARPFVTHHNALDLPLYLRIAPELYLKRLLVGGMGKVFEINRNFRNEGVSPRHNPEFTMLEAYEAYGDWETMSDMVEEMVCHVAKEVLGTLIVEHRDEAGNVTRTIDLTRPWRRVAMSELVAERTGRTFDRDRSGAGELVQTFEKEVEPTLINPCYVTRVPGEIIPLARRCEDDPFFADVYELVINGMEISPGYTELNDPDVQAEQFRGQIAAAEERQQVDEDFLTALKVGMPPAGGMGLGIDRLVMTLLGQSSLRDVIAFPLMRPERPDVP